MTKNFTCYKDAYLAGKIRRTRQATLQKNIDKWDVIQGDKSDLHTYLGLTSNEFFIYRVNPQRFFQYLDKKKIEHEQKNKVTKLSKQGSKNS